MSGLLMKDLELLKVNIKRISLFLRLGSFICLSRQTEVFFS